MEVKLFIYHRRVNNSNYNFLFFCFELLEVNILLFFIFYDFFYLFLFSIIFISNLTDIGQINWIFL